MNSAGAASQLHILLPGLLSPLWQWEQAQAPLPRFVSLETLLARSRVSPAPPSFEATLCACFGVQRDDHRDLPLAPIRRFGSGGGADSDYWMCADPVHLRADVDTVFLDDSNSLHIEPSEADELCVLFNEHFSEHGWSLETASPSHWHLRVAAEQAMRAQPLPQLMGRGIRDSLPADAFWRGVLTELQMLYHGAEVNRRRESAGLPTINSLWFWGGGTLPAAAASWSAVWGNGALTHGLARLAGIDMHLVEEALAVIPAVAESRLLCIESLRVPANYEQYTDWIAVLQDLETRLFAPLATALRNGNVTEAHLYDCQGRRFSLSRRQLWRVWQRPQSLYAYARKVT